jgi:hypothetical protein
MMQRLPLIYLAISRSPMVWFALICIKLSVVLTKLKPNPAGTALSSGTITRSLPLRRPAAVSSS